MKSTASHRSRRWGIDLGGTKTEIACIDVVGAIDPSSSTSNEDSFDTVLRERAPTPASEGYDAIVRATAELARAALGRIERDGASKVVLGVGMPGGVERLTGHVKNSNTTCLNGRDFRGDLARALAPLGVETVFENDANCFALAEARLGAAKTHARGVVFGVILGTGVGGGVVINGRVHAGRHGIAGEWGHHGVWALRPDARPCYCGKRGCVEAHASGPALAAIYAEATGERVDFREITRRAARGEDAAIRAQNELIATFGRGLANVIDVLDPDVIVLGGGLSNVDLLYSEGRAAVAREVFNDELATPIVKHALGDSAGVIGACLLDARPADGGL